MKMSRRTLVRNIGLGIAGASVASKALAQSAGELESESLFVKDRAHPEPAPIGYDRLPLSWYQSATQRLKDRLRPEGVDAIVLQRDVNAAVSAAAVSALHGSCFAWMRPTPPIGSRRELTGT